MAFIVCFLRFRYRNRHSLKIAFQLHQDRFISFNIFHKITTLQRGTKAVVYYAKMGATIQVAFNSSIIHQITVDAVPSLFRS